MHICSTKTRHINSLLMKIIFGSHTPIPNQYSSKQNPGVTFWWVLCEIGCSWPVLRTHSQDSQESSDCHGENYLYQSGSGKHNPLGIMDGGTSYKKPTATLHCRQKEGKCRDAVGIAQWLIWETKMASHREKGWEGDEKLSPVRLSSVQSSASFWERPGAAVNLQLRQRTDVEQRRAEQLELVGHPSIFPSLQWWLQRTFRENATPSASQSLLQGCKCLGLTSRTQHEASYLPARQPCIVQTNAREGLVISASWCPHLG